MLIAILFTLVAQVHAQTNFTPAFTPFTWRKARVESYEKFVTIARAIKKPVDATRLRRAAAPNGDEVFGAVINRIDSAPAAEKYAELFGVEHPIFGSPARLRATRPDYRAQLLRLIERDLTPAQINELRQIAPDLTYHGIKDLRQRINTSAATPLAFNLWREGMRAAQAHCDGYLAGSRLYLKNYKFISQTALAFQLMALAERHAVEAPSLREGFEQLWAVGDLYSEYLRYDKHFANWAEAKRNFAKRTRGTGWRRLLARRDAEMRIDYLELCQRRVQARLDHARDFGQFNFNGTSEIPFDETVHRDVGLDIEIAVKLETLRAERARLDQLIRGG